MPWNLLLIPLAGGYYILTRSHLFKFKQQRLDKQRLLLDSVLLGIALVSFTFILKFCSNFVLHGVYEWVHDQLPYKENHFGTVFCSIIFSILFVEASNRCYKVTDQTKKAIEDIGSELEKMLMIAFEKKLLLQFTLDTGKVYVGWVTKLPVPTITDYIQIIPALSGYRSIKGSLSFTTNYAGVYKEHFGKTHIDDLREENVHLIITMDNVVTVAYFDLLMYRRFTTK